MAEHLHWRAVAITVPGNGNLEISEWRLFGNGGVVDAPATITSAMAPSTGSLALLRDGVATSSAVWLDAEYSHPGFYIAWEFPTPVSVTGLVLGSGAGYSTFPVGFSFQYSDDGVLWGTDQVVNGAKFPGAFSLTAEPVEEVGDTYYSNVSLLLHCEGTSGASVVTDDSIVGRVPQTITAALSDAQALFGSTSLYFSGSTLLLYAADASTDFTGDYTLEAFFFPTTDARMTIFETRSTGAQLSVSFNYEPGGNLGCYLHPNSTVSTGGGVNIGAWNHVAICRIGSSVSLYANGVRLEVASHAVPGNGGSALRISGNVDGSYAIQGYLDDVRVTKGYSRYSGTSYQVPSDTFPIGAVDANFGAVSYLLSFDGADASTVFPDSSYNSHALTAVGGAALSTGVKKFGAASLALNGSSAKVTAPSDATIEFGSDDYTVEAWVYSSSAADSGVIFKGEYLGAAWDAGWGIRTFSTGTARFYFNTTNSNTTEKFVDATLWSLNAWHHVAMCVVSGTGRAFIDGVLVGTLSGVGAIPTSAKGLTLGFFPFTSTSYYFNGYLDEVRITKGVGRYPTAFTIPSRAFSSASNDPYLDSVEILGLFNGANGAAPVDNSPTPKTFTAQGGAVALSTAQFKFGGASAFFSSNSWLSCTVPAVGSGAFTCETFLYLTSYTAFPTVFGSGAGGFSFGVTTGGYLFCSNSFVAIILTGSNTVPLNTWVHVAVSRSSGVLRMFVNGVLDASVANTTDWTTTAYGIGGYPGMTTQGWMNGYMDDFRLTVGHGRYTSNFSAPSSSFAEVISYVELASPIVYGYSAPVLVSPTQNFAGDIYGTVHYFTVMPGEPRRFNDAYFGGLGSVYGTVKEKNMPVNTPLRRKVFLLHEVSKYLVAETWSDAVTGNFEFRGVDISQKFTTISYDHEHNYRATAMDNLTPLLMVP